MKASLRARIFLGAILWSAGLFLLSGLVLTHYMLYVPAAPGIFHGVFVHYMIIVVVTMVASIAVGFVQVKRGLASFNELRANLGDVREGRDARLGGEYPSEVQPLVSELNELLADREQRITKAHRKAASRLIGWTRRSIRRACSRPSQAASISRRWGCRCSADACSRKATMRARRTS